MSHWDVPLGCPDPKIPQKTSIDSANLRIPKGKSAASISLIHCGYFSSTSFSVMAQTPGHRYAMQRPKLLKRRMVYFTNKYGDIMGR